jgi:hypothetical protein
MAQSRIANASITTTDAEIPVQSGTAAITAIGNPAQNGFIAVPQIADGF